jgi:hypothetical protein
MVSLSQCCLEWIKHKVVYLILFYLSMVWDCHLNLLEPILMHKIVPWSSFVFITLSRNEKQAVCARFLGSCTRVHAPIWLTFFLVT